MKLTERTNLILEARVLVIIKPTKHNVSVLKKRGVHSDDSRYFFDMYDKLLSGENYEKEIKDKWDNAITDEFTKADLKF